MDEIIEIMARADVGCTPDKPFEQLDDAAAESVRSRMRAIVAALEAAGFSISPAAEEDGWIFR